MHRTVSMMQPYLFPYLGYFQLIATSDAFVLGDDLQYVKGSWINRNRVLCDGQPKLISFPLKKASHLGTIRERWLCDEFDKEAAALKEEARKEAILRLKGFQVVGSMENPPASPVATAQARGGQG